MKRKSKVIRAIWPRVSKLKTEDKPIYMVDGRPVFRRRYFRDSRVALNFAEGLVEMRKESEAEEPQTLSSRDIMDVLDGKKKLEKRGATIREAIDHYLQFLEKNHIEGGKRMTAGRAFNRYIEHRMKQFEDGQISSGTYHGSLRRLKSDQVYFYDTLLSEISPSKIMEYLEIGNFSPTTRRNNKVRLSHFFNFCRLHGWIENNPCSPISIKVKRGEVKIFTVEETIELMRECSYSDKADVLVPFAAIGFFAGLRPKELERLNWEDIDFETKHIELKATASKVRQARFIRMEPNLIEWLLPHRRDLGRVMGKTSPRKEWDNIRSNCGWISRGRGTKPWIADGMRHSYASYWLAVYKNRAELAELMGNSQEIIRVHYRRPVLEDVAKEFWKITPNSVLRKE